MALTYTLASQSIIFSNFFDDVIEFEGFALDCAQWRGHLFSTDLVPPSIDGVKQALGEIGPGAEKLHLFAHQHRRHTTGDRSVVAPGAAHDFVVLKLKGTGVDRDFGGKMPKAIGQTRGIPDGQIRLRGRAKVVQGLKKAKARFRYQRPAVVSHAANRLGDPSRIAGEKVIVFRRAQKANDAQLDHEIIDDLLGLRLGDRASRKVPFKVDVEEARRPAQRHGGAVLFFHGRQIAKVKPLDGFSGIAGRHRDIESVTGGHLLQFLERPDLLAEFFPVADNLFRRHGCIEAEFFLLFPFNEPGNPVKGHAPVVADDAAAPVSVGQAGEDVRAAAPPDVRRVGIEHRLIVGLPILGKCLNHVGIGLVAVSFEGIGNHAEAAIGHDGAL